MANRLAAEELAQHSHAFGQTGAAFVMRHVAGRVFARELTADTDAKNESSLGQMIQRADLLGHRCRMPQGQQQYRGAEQQSPADHGGLCQLQERIEDRHGKGNVVAHPQ